MNEGRASHIQPPRLLTSTGTTNVRYFDATTLSQCHALPAEWAGEYVRIKCAGGTVDYYVTSVSTAAIDRTVAAASTGASSSSLGERMEAGEIDYFVVPSQAGATQYLVRQADVSTATLRLTLRTGAA